MVRSVERRSAVSNTLYTTQCWAFAAFRGTDLPPGCGGLGDVVVFGTVCAAATVTSEPGSFPSKHPAVAVTLTGIAALVPILKSPLSGSGTIGGL